MTQPAQPPTADLTAKGNACIRLFAFKRKAPVAEHPFTAENAPLVFQAMADATRLRLLEVLLGGEQCVSELCKALQIAQPFCSRHLAVLRHAHLVVSHRKAQRIVYSLHRAVHAKLRNHLRILDLGCCEVRFPVQDA